MVHRKALEGNLEVFLLRVIGLWFWVDLLHVDLSRSLTPLSCIRSTGCRISSQLSLNSEFCTPNVGKVSSRGSQSPMLRTTILLRLTAVQLRQQGKSLKEIVTVTGVAQSTLSDWFRWIKLPESAERIIQERKHAANKKARHASWVKFTLR